MEGRLIRIIQHSCFFSIKFLISTFVLILLSNCSKNSTDPPPAGVDTTSHNFVWRMDTIGTHSSYLLDVTIINENDIWAVGEIHTLETDRFDSLGNWVDPYNATHWNGQEWELIRIPVKIFNTPNFGIFPLQAIHSFATDDIYVTTGGEVIHFDGDTWKKWTFLFDDLNDTTFGGINRFWGTENGNLYGAGNKGNVFFYDGTNWQRLNSGTAIDIRDIWGAQKPDGSYEILSIASSPFISSAQLFQIDGTMVTPVPNGNFTVTLSTIWFIPGQCYYVGGDGFYSTPSFESAWQQNSDFPPYYKQTIRGFGKNEIFVTGAFGLVSHYNGASWHHYTGNDLPIINGTYVKFDWNNNHFVAVGGIIENQGIILQGVRM